MFTLFVSHDCGCSYFPEHTAETLEELRPRMDKLNVDMLRWYLEMDGKTYQEEVCNVHRDILRFMERVNSQV